MADHNDPNAVNSIFSDIDVSAADLYDIFGFPSEDPTGVEKVVIALTFSATPQTGVFDTDMLYRILIAPDRRIARSGNDDTSLGGLLTYLEGVKERYLKILKSSEDNRQLGANNFWLAPHFIKRLGHLGWGFGPSITALGLASAFDHDNSLVSVHRTYSSVLEAFPRVQKILFQELNMPDDSWNRKGLAIPLRRAVDIFIPNVNSIDMDTTGTWPFGRRLEDQVATRFLSTFLDMSASVNGRRYHVDLLIDPALWNAAAIEPKTPPNPLKNDKEFLADFPYLAEPW